MKFLRVARARWRGLLHKDQLEAELDEELQFHLTRATEDGIARGMRPEVAARAARRQFGHVERIKDEWRDVIGGGWLEAFAQDVRFSIRMLRQDRSFTAAAVLALALGIAVNAALFTIVSSVLLRPLPFPEPDRIVTMWHGERGTAAVRALFSHPDFYDLQARAESLETIAGFRTVPVVATFDGRDGVQLQGTEVSSETFAVLRAKPAVGRTFTAEDDQPGHAVCMLSDELWRERFGRSPHVTRATVMLGGREFAVIGVMPPSFRFPIANERTVIWMSFAAAREPFADGTGAYAAQRSGRSLTLIGRLKNGRTAADASAELTDIAADLAQKFPATNRHYDSITVVPWLSGLTRTARPPLLMLLGGGGCVLLLACVNIANLLLARASTRQRAFAIRAALGAGRRRIVRQLLTESLLVGVLGGTIGLLLAWWGIDHLAELLPADFPRRSEVALDVRVLAFTVAATLVTSFVFGFAPARRVAAGEVAPVLNDSSRGSTEARQTRRTRDALIVIQMALAFVLLVSALFLLHAFSILEHAPFRFTTRDLATVSVTLPDEHKPDSRGQIASTFHDLLGRLRQLDSIRNAAGIYTAPVAGMKYVADFEIMDRPTHRSLWPVAEVHTITPGYFATMQIPFVSGRDFDERDRRDALPTVIINEKLARTIFPGVDPLGKRIRPGFSDSTWYPEREIIGVVADTRNDALVLDPAMQAYMPHAQCISDQMQLMLRTDLRGEELVRVVREALDEVATGVAVEQPGTVEQQIDAALAPPRLNSTLASIFAALATLLTGVGAYGVTAYSVAQRRHEIGIRLALGAQKFAVFRMVIADVLRLVGVAIVVGTACSVGVLPLLSRFAYGTTASIASPIVTVAVMLALLALIACWRPAKRAASEDPLAAIGQR